jgi:hypothetical protein
MVSTSDPARAGGGMPISSTVDGERLVAEMVLPSPPGRS